MRRIIVVGKNKDFPRFTPRQARKPANWWIEAAVEVVTVVGGLAVFGAAAFFFLVLA